MTRVLHTALDGPHSRPVFVPLTLRDTVSLTARARRLLGWGAASVDVRPLFFGDALLPQFSRSIGGYEVIDTNGRRYVDWFGGGCNLLGYGEPRVDAAVRAQLLDAGPLLPSINPLEVEVAECLVDTIPCAEMVVFGKNGSDGLTAAVRLARIVTGRDVVLYCGWHGFHDWFAAADPVNEGIPAALRELIHPFRYNDIEHLRELLQRFQVAAVVMEPVKTEMPAPGYLEAVRALTRDAGCLLIFDEVVTALRLGNGGAQEAFGVVPDLACLGKSLGNGMPLSALVGRRDIMRHHPRTGVGMTFQGETLSLAAARAVLQIVRDEPVAKRIAELGTIVGDGFANAARERGIEASVTAHPARPVLNFADRGDFPGDYLMQVFMLACLRGGVATGRMMFPSYAHDDRAVDTTLAVFRDALDVVARTVEGEFRGWVLPGEPDVLGFLDRVDDGVAAGWILVNGAAADELSAFTVDGDPIAIAPANRADVAAIYPGGAESGFVAQVGAAAAILIVARRDNATARCIVEWSAGEFPIALKQGRIAS